MHEEAGMMAAESVGAESPAESPGKGATAQMNNAIDLHPAIIAIDGPAASGKSTVAEQLAQRLNFLYFDTGVMYRAVTWAVLQQGIEPNQEETVGEIAERIQIDIAPAGAEAADGRQSTVLVDGQDVTWQIRAPEIDQNVSAVSANPAVRRALTVQQRRIAQQYGTGRAEKPGVVMVGRDIGTVVLPDAPLKIYLDASQAERARRRHSEQQERGKTVAYEQVLADMQRRDQLDSQRALAPLRPADDALVLDTTDLSIEQVVARILELAGKKREN
jgi:cytidylate kinase